MKFATKNSLFWSILNWKYGQWPHFLKTPSEIIGYNFKIYEKFKKLTLALMCRFLWFFFCISSAKRSCTICIRLISIICFYAYIVRRHAYVPNLCNKWFSLLMVYSYSETNENPAKFFLKVMQVQKGQL
jgi:hypothetical protein